MIQFAKLYEKHKDKKVEFQDLHWGEEIEYHLYSLDETKHVVKLSCDASEILFNFNKELAKNEEKPDFKLLPEFGNWMIEAVPSAPYGSCANPD